jgi:hypothetical protein
MTSYVKIPLALFEGLDNGSITPEQFDIYCYTYWKATRPEYRVQSYSAENVCRFRGLDATKANLARYKRAAADMLHQNLIRRDYYRIDPKRSAKSTRTYSLWAPNPERFNAIGTREENLCLWTQADKDDSLFVSAFVPLLDRDNVPLPANVTDSTEGTSDAWQRDNVPVVVPLGLSSLFVTNHCDPKTREKEPLNPPSGDFSPAPLPLKGEDAQAAGLSNLHRKSNAAGKEKPLDANECLQLDQLALLYAGFSAWMYANKFMPDETHVRAILRQFSPRELLFAQIERFSPDETIPKMSMAQFFFKSARTAILESRLKGTSNSRPAFLTEMPEYRRNVKPINDRWKFVADAWNKIAPDGQQDSGEIATAPPPKPATAVAENITEAKQDNEEVKIGYDFHCPNCGKRHSSYVIVPNNRTIFRAENTRPCGVIIAQLTRTTGVQS